MIAPPLTGNSYDLCQLTRRSVEVENISIMVRAPCREGPAKAFNGNGNQESLSNGVHCEGK